MLSEDRQPFQLIQEELLDDPWRVLLACILLNQTRVQQVMPILEELLDEWPNAAMMAAAPEDDVEAIIAPIGLKKRGGYIVEMSAAYCAKRPTKWEEVLELAGCGRYAAETWRMLIDGDHTFIPNDLKLRARMIWLRLDECSVIFDRNNRIAVTLPGNERGTPVIMLNSDIVPGYWRDVMILSKDAKRGWRTLEGHTPTETVEKWLDSQFIGLTQRAKEAIMLLVLNEKGKFIGKFAYGEEATIEKAVPAGSVTYGNAKALTVLSIAALLVAYNSIVPKDDRVKKFDEGVDVDAAAELVWKAAETKTVKVKETKEARPAGHKEQLRAALIGAGDEGMSMDEMAALLKCEKKRCSDYICYLKNAKFAGKTGVLPIVKHGDRFFASAANATAYAEAHPVPAPEQKTEGGEQAGAENKEGGEVAPE